MEKKMTEIKLDKDICVGKLLYAWCLSSCWTERGIYYHKPKKKQNQSICFREYVEGLRSVLTEDVAEFYPHNQKLLIHNREKFEPVLKDLNLS